MSKVFRDIASYIRQSVHGNGGYISHTKISSYFILGGILTSIIIFSIVDIMNALISWHNGTTYTLPYEHIFIYSLTLTHHLILLGLKKGSDSDYLKYSVRNNEIKYNSLAQAQVQQQYDNDNGNYGYGNNYGGGYGNGNSNYHNYNRNNRNNNNNSNNNQNNKMPKFHTFNGSGTIDNIENNAPYNDNLPNNPDDNEASSSNFGEDYDGRM